MTKKDFQLIANTIRNSLNEGKEKDLIILGFSASLKKTNENFDVDRFQRACLA